MKNFMFCVFLLCILFIPTAAFASSDDPSSNIFTNFVSIFCGTPTNSNYPGSSYTGNESLDTSTSYSNTENCDATKDTYYSKDDCNNPPPEDSNDLWQRWYCGGGEWGSF